MKYLSSILIGLAFVLSSCANVMESPPEEDISIESAPTGDVQESTFSGTNPGQASSEIKVEVVGGDEESLREFIKQWMTPTYPDGSSKDMTVYIGSLPQDIPYELPVPDDARVIGSITGGWVDYQLIYDTSLSSESLHEFYAQSLVEKGWQEAPTNQAPSGFVSQSNLYRGYCREEGKAYLNLETPSISAAKTGIRLTLDTSPDPQMCDPSAVNMGGYSHQNLIPQLNAPQGALVQGGGAGTSDRDAEISANIKSDLAPAELVESYNSQLTAAGWKMQNNSAGGGAAWSNWTLQDEKGTNWLGSLIVVEASPDSDSLFALLRIVKDE